MVDVDPQGNATSGLGVNKKDVEKSTYDMIVAGVKAEDIISIYLEGTQIVPYFTIANQ